MFSRKANLTKQVDHLGLDAFEMSERLEKTLLSNNKASFKTKKSFSPSAVGYGNGTCARYWHLAFSGAEFVDEPDAKGVLNMDNGNYVHDRIQALFQKAYGEENVELERKIESANPPIFGFADLLVDVDGVKVVGEIKSAKQEIFDGIAHKGQPINYHLVQLLIYMRVLGLDHGFFHYENKNTQEFTIIEVSMTEALNKYTDEIFDWMTTVRKAFDEGKLAEPLSPKRTVKACRYCPIKADCLSRPDGDIKIPQLEIKD